MMLVYKLTDVNFLSRAVFIEVCIILLILLSMIAVRVIQTLRAKKLREHKQNLNLLLDDAILHDRPIDVSKVPEDLKSMYVLLPILEAYNHNFKDAIWKECKERLIDAYLAKDLNKYLQSRQWQKRQEGLRLMALWPEKLFSKDFAVPLLQDKVYLVRVAAAHCLIKTGEHDYVKMVLERMVQESRLSQYPFRDALIQGGPRVFEQLEKIAENDQNPLVVAVCLDVLSTRTNHNLLPLAKQYLHSPDMLCRLGAIKVFESIGGIESTQSITERLMDGDPVIRRTSAKALGRLRAVSSVPQLVLLLQDSDYLTRLNAAIALKEITPEGRDALFGQKPEISRVAYDTAQYILAIPD